MVTLRNHRKILALNGSFIVGQIGFCKITYSDDVIELPNVNASSPEHIGLK
jgi:hypothetical protein